MVGGGMENGRKEGNNGNYNHKVQCLKQKNDQRRRK